MSPRIAFTSAVQKGGAEAIGIKPGHAGITVMEAPGVSQQTLDQVIADFTQDAIVLSREEVPVQAVPRSCSALKEITTEEPAVPSEDAIVSVPMIVNTDLFCKAWGTHNRDSSQELERR